LTTGSVYHRQRIALTRSLLAAAFNLESAPEGVVAQ
jgi:hypothetical protein